MADAEVEFLLVRLKELIEESHPTSDVKYRVEWLEPILQLFKIFLYKTRKTRRKDDGIAEFARRVQDAVYQAEDFIDTFVLVVVATRRPPTLGQLKHLKSIAKQVQSVGYEVEAILLGDMRLMDFNTLGVDDGSGHEEKETPVLKKNNVVGFEDEAKTLIGYLNEETYQLDVISIIGMPGLGKTTIAGMIFQDLAIECAFPIRIWVYISQEFTTRNVFIAILEELLTMLNDDIYRKTDQELAQLVAAHLQIGKFLIVLDDVWTTEDWKKLKIAFPKEIKMGKVLITSRNEKVARYANHTRPPHMLRFLTRDEGWLLFKREVFGNADSPVDLISLGNLIVDRCAMLPLAIVVIGGILVKQTSATNETGAIVKEWTKVSESVNQYITNEDPTRRMERVIELSYDKLPYHLKACFLYLGMFPENLEIRVWKLTRMWIAEGFVQQSEGNTLEETAYNYLDELINRSLVRKAKMRRDGKVKTCLINVMLHEYCSAKAGRENFLQEIRMSSQGTFYPSVAQIQNYRRLCIHSNVKKFVSSSKLYGPRVRSFVCFSKEDVNFGKVSTISSAFRQLRVLEAEPLKFSEIPSNIYQLVHLKYLALSFNLNVLPQNFSNLWNIQTLILHTISPTLEIKADIWKFMQLRHFKINARATLPKIGKDSEGGEKIQTLGTISPESCTEEVLNRARNVKDLGIRGELGMLLDAKNVSFRSLRKLTNLEKLKLINDVFPSLPSENKLPRPPPVHHFPRKLRSLTLLSTYLEWTYMSILGLLENLEVLKLKDNAFVGRVWSVTYGGFRNLEVLHIERTNLVIWTASGSLFPKLRSLDLRYCEELRDIPIRLADITPFHSLNLHWTKYAADSAKEIRNKKQKAEEAQTVKSSAFELSIFPSKD